MPTEYRHHFDVQMTETQENNAFWKWKVSSVQHQADRLVAKTLAVGHPTIADPLLDMLAGTEHLSVNSWLNVARTAMCLSGNEIARRIGIHRSAYYKIESQERLGMVRLETLRLVAEAMDCELVYAIRPRRASYAETIWKNAKKHAEQRFLVKHAEPLRKDLALAHAVTLEIQRPEVRRSEKWTERHRRNLKRPTPKRKNEITSSSKISNNR